MFDQPQRENVEIEEVGFFPVNNKKIRGLAIFLTN
jgi:hypothetical protein